MAPLAGAFGGLLASGILKLDGIGSVRTWEQLFLVGMSLAPSPPLLIGFVNTDDQLTCRMDCLIAATSYPLQRASSLAVSL